MLKVTVFLLVLSALIATSCSAPTEKEPTAEEQPIQKVIFIDGKKGPGDYRIASYSTKRKPNKILLENAPDATWDYYKDNANISYVEVVQVGSTKATASITSGGVGTNHLTFTVVPDNGGGFHFTVDVWGTLTQ